MSYLISNNRLIVSSNRGKAIRTGLAYSKFVACPIIPVLQTANDFTIRVKFILIGNSLDGVIVSKGGGSENNIQWLLDIEGGNFRIYQGTVNGVGWGSWSYEAAKRFHWYDIIYSRQGNTVKLSIDGAAYINNSYAGTAVAWATPATFGGYSTGTFPLEAIFSQATIWNSSLPISDIINNTTAAQNNLIVDYRFINGNVQDSSPNGFHGDIWNDGLNRATTPQYVGNFNPDSSVVEQRVINIPASNEVVLELNASDYVNGNVLPDSSSYKRNALLIGLLPILSGGYLTFTGNNNQGIKLNDAPYITGKRDFTLLIEFKIANYRSAPRDWCAIIGKGNYQTGDYTILMHITDGTSPQPINFYSNGTVILTVMINNLAINTNYKLVYTRSGNILSCYLNGILLGSNSSFTTAIPISNTNGNTIGLESLGTNYALEGGFKRAKIYSRALNSTEIAAL